MEATRPEEDSGKSEKGVSDGTTSSDSEEDEVESEEDPEPPTLEGEYEEMRMSPAVSALLDERLTAHSKDPNGILDLSGLEFGIEGAEKVASFLSKW